MIPGLDSAYPPSALSISAARGAGIRVWAGYFAGRNIYNGWSQAAFHQVQTGGLGTFAYCSGYSDPAAMRAQSLTWGVPICLDVEDLIRPDGAWVQGWVDAAASGLYGNGAVHKNRTAAFHVIAAYPGSDPHATWPAFLPRPASPCGWQWQGTHTAYGASVDSSWLDDDLLGLSGDSEHSGGRDMPLLLKDANSAKVYMVGESGKRLLSANELGIYVANNLQILSAPGAFIAEIPDASSGNSITASKVTGSFTATVT